MLQFDRAINAATLGTGVLVQTGGVAVPGTFVQEDGQQRVRFTPANPLLASTSYVVTLTSELKDVVRKRADQPGNDLVHLRARQRHHGADGDGKHAVLQPDRGRPAAGHSRGASAR